MSNWRREKPRNNNINHHQRGTTMMQSSSKPPLANCKLSVPAWEKDFCAVIGSVPWWKLVERKRYIHIYDRVIEWDDSAVADAFKNAKSRFWAEINGFTCDLPLPDPDVYIDDVDWDAEVDTELMLDLERGPEPRTGEEEPVVIFDALALTGDHWGTGWGDAEGINEDNFMNFKKAEPEVTWDDEKGNGWNEDSWGRKEKTESWDLNNNSSCKRESWDLNNNNSFKRETWDHKNRNNNSFNNRKVENWNGRDQGRESREWRKRGEVGSGGYQVEDCRWRNGRGRSRGGFQQQSNGWGWTESF
ncbi:hypothetical protein V5N11_002701 [Cardamine amara subsp. amara]|uniref:Uncharacterized protein n=1 Tax=Cardamine amara subsp. amara TaxID=228776 RepID=A0ABD1A3X2_CARAN